LREFSLGPRDACLHGVGMWRGLHFGSKVLKTSPTRNIKCLKLLYFKIKAALFLFNHETIII
jgi:hypothetical protein